MGTATWITGQMAEEDAMMKIHEASMSKDPRVACSGRLMKEVGPSLIRWIEDELKRGSATEAILGAAADIAAGIVTTACANVVMNRGKDPGPDQLALALDVTVNTYFARAVGATMEHARENPDLTKP